MYGRPCISGIDNLKLIGITDETRKAVITSGGIPIIICPTQDIIYYGSNEYELSLKDKELLDNQIDLCDGIIMPGGYKIFNYDNYICYKANKINIPLLGICMGMQIMCNYNNENINIKVEGHRKKDTTCTHKVEISKKSNLYSILRKEKIDTNSFHSYAVPNSGDYSVVGKCGDVIEAIEKDDSLFNIGVQWHPEKDYNEDNRKLLTTFIRCSTIYGTYKLLRLLNKSF